MRFSVYTKNVDKKLKSILSSESINYLHIRDKFQAVSVLLVLLCSRETWGFVLLKP